MRQPTTPRSWKQPYPNSRPLGFLPDEDWPFTSTDFLKAVTQVRFERLETSPPVRKPGHFLDKGPPGAHALLLSSAAYRKFGASRLVFREMWDTTYLALRLLAIKLVPHCAAGARSLSHSKAVGNRTGVPRSPERTPDFLSSLLALGKFMRLSLMKAAHAVGVRPVQEIRIRWNRKDLAAPRSLLLIDQHSRVSQQLSNATPKP